MKTYEQATGVVEALRGVDIDLDGGLFTTISGPSGSGKSSLLRLIAGLDIPNEGTVEVDGVTFSSIGPVARRRKRRDLIGFVFQRPADNLIGYLSVGDHARLAADLRNVPREHAQEILRSLGIDHLHASKPRQLSGGEQQRLAFAQAAIGGPAVVIADEPTAELDDQATVSLIEAIKNLTRQGICVVAATHDPEVIELADVNVALHEGRVEA